jgi:AGZA family xanthine/uracil permease-like MFS transporter
MGLAVLWRLPGGMLGVIVLTFLLGNALGVSRMGAVAAWPDLGALGEIASLWPLADWKLNLASFLTPAFLLAVFFPVFLMDFFDTLGTLIGVSARAGFLDAKGDLPEIEKPMLCDALASVWGALLGTTTTGTYIESATGVEAGGRSGLTAVVTGLLFLAALFFIPFFGAVPGYAYAPALVIVGILMMESVKQIDFADFTELVPAFSVIVLIPFTFNIGVGMAAGFLLYPLLKLLTGRVKDVSAGGIIFAGASLLFFLCFPY